MARFAKRVRSIEPSPTVRISDLIAESQGQGQKILSLAIGEPDFPTPAHIVDAARMALGIGYIRASAAPGIRELRAAIAEKSQKENGIPAKPENVIVAPTKHTLFMTFMALLESGDEGLIPDPGWVSYAPMVTLAGAKPVPVRAADEDGFVPSTETVADAITPRTRLIVLNSPSNPAGSVYTRAQMRGLADLAADHDLTIVRVDVGVKSALLAERILKEANVAVTPGSAFGDAGEGHLRLSYAASRETIVESIRRIADVLQRI